MKSFTEYLTEIGDSNRPYPYHFNRLTQVGDYYVGPVHVRADSGVFIIHLITKKRGNKYYTTIDFESETTGMATTNAGLNQAFRILATVITATKEYLTKIYEKYSVKSKYLDIITHGFEDHSGKKSSGAKRMKLYLAFIKKNMKDVKIIQSDLGYTKLEVKDSFYR